MDQGRNAFGLFVLLARESARRASSAVRTTSAARRIMRSRLSAGPQQTLCGGHSDYCRESTLKSVTVEASRVSVHDLGDRSALLLLEPRPTVSAASASPTSARRASPRRSRNVGRSRRRTVAPGLAGPVAQPLRAARSRS